MHTTSTLDAYDQATTSAQVDPEAHPRGGPPGPPTLAAMDRLPTRWPCADVAAEWVPLREEVLVPGPLVATCGRCPLRGDCLAGAIARDEHGYWAGTTTADRRAMRAAGTTSLPAADACQTRAAQALAQRSAAPTHAPVAAGYRGYRRGCRCSRCRAGNAAARGAERRQSRERVGA